MKQNRKLTIGILAHVDAGKTTLSEAILFRTGTIRKMGRVDHGDAFLDSDIQEKNRGITIFAGQAEFTVSGNGTDTDVMLLDTPGHVDFSAEMERTLQVLDYAILVVSGKDGVQGHTVTLWNLLEQYGVPTFIFVNKMDMEGTDSEKIMRQLKEQLGTSCSRISDVEDIAVCDESMLEEYLESGSISSRTKAAAIKRRKLFPCYFGSALKLDGVDELLTGLADLTQGWECEDSADRYENAGGKPQIRIFRITRDKQGERLTHMKILSGVLRAKDLIPTGKDGKTEKINQIRIYSGEKYRTVDKAGPGSICAVTGPAETKPDGTARLEAVMTYDIIPEEGTDVHSAYVSLKQLEEEDPQLHIVWNEQLRQIQARLMGEVQMEVLAGIIKQRFGFEAAFGDGRISYKETIRKSVSGAGHYEPLRHYAEVHLRLEPLPQGSGMEFTSELSEDILDRNWQRLIMTHLIEKEHTGTLTGSPITDIRIVLTAGRAHEKHTEGGDFRQATYRAIRQALRKSLRAEDVILLEPWYDFRLSIPGETVGRAMSDIQRMGGEFDAPQMLENEAVVRGSAPVSEMKGYAAEVASYTKGYGRLNCSMAGCRPCHDQDRIVAEYAYDADRDIDNPADSVFCSHGAGHNVPWDEADEMMHVSAGGNAEKGRGIQPQSTDGAAMGNAVMPGDSEDEELQRIFDRTYRRSESAGRSVEAREFDSELERRRKEAERRRRANEAAGKREEQALPEYLLVDGYNIIFAWEDLKELAKVSIDGAREALIEILGNYRGFRKCEVIVVFDAYKVKGGKRHIEESYGISVVYTKEAETADTYIERTTYELSGKSGKPRCRVRVATSDRLEQMIITGNNAMKISAADFRAEIEQVNREIAEIIKKLARKNEIENPNRLKIPVDTQNTQ